MGDNEDDNPRPSNPEFDAKLDLLDRFDAMTQTQVETLSEIDDKASYTARLVGILIGLLLSSASVVATADWITLSIDTGIAFVLLTLAAIALFFSLTAAIITYLSSRFAYGPTVRAADYLIRDNPPDDEYKDLLLRGYGHAIQANRRVVKTNSRRFEASLASLLVGVLFLFGAGGLLIVPSGWAVDLLVLALFLGSAYRVATYILREEYLTLERHSPDNE